MSAIERLCIHCDTRMQNASNGDIDAVMETVGVLSAFVEISTLLHSVHDTDPSKRADIERRQRELGADIKATLVAVEEFLAKTPASRH